LPKDAQGHLINGDIPWRADFVTVGVDPATVKLTPLAISDSKDDRWRLIKKP